MKREDKAAGPAAVEQYLGDGLTGRMSEQLSP